MMWPVGAAPVAGAVHVTRIVPPEMTLRLVGGPGLSAAAPFEAMAPEHSADVDGHVAIGGAIVDPPATARTHPVTTTSDRAISSSSESATLIAAPA